MSLYERNQELRKEARDQQREIASLQSDLNTIGLFLCAALRCGTTNINQRDALFMALHYATRIERPLLEVLVEQIDPRTIYLNKQRYDNAPE